MKMVMNIIVKLPILIVCFYYITYAFQSESPLCRCLNVKELHGRTRRDIWSLSNCNGAQTHAHLFVNEQSTIFPNQPNNWAVLWVLICTVDLAVCSYYVKYDFQSESTLYSFAWMSRNSLLEAGAISEV